MEISQLICIANQLAGFYMRATLAFNELKVFLKCRSLFSPTGKFLRTSHHNHHSNLVVGILTTANLPVLFSILAIPPFPSFEDIIQIRGKML